MSEQHAATKIEPEIEELRNKAVAATVLNWSKVSLPLYQLVTQYEDMQAMRGRKKGARLEIYGLLDPALKGAERADYRDGGELEPHYDALENAFRKGKAEAVKKSRTDRSEFKL